MIVDLEQRAQPSFQGALVAYGGGYLEVQGLGGARRDKIYFHAATRGLRTVEVTRLPFRSIGSKCDG